MSAADEAAKVLYAASDEYAEEGVEYEDNHASGSREARRQAEALAAAGLLRDGETRTEWATSVARGQVDRGPAMTAEQHAEQGIAEVIAGVVDTEACRRCSANNVRWCAPSPLWNKVMRGNDINAEPLFHDLVCIPCFIAIAAEVGVDPRRWRLTCEPLPGDLVYKTPSGRVWDSELWLWVEPADVDEPFCSNCRDSHSIDVSCSANARTLAPPALVASPQFARCIADAKAEAWDEGAEATAEWMANNPSPSGIPHDPPRNPYDDALTEDVRGEGR